MEEGKPSGPILHLGYYHFDKGGLISEGIDYSVT